MTTYYVTIKASVTKTIEVEADNQEKAEAEPHEEFSVLCDSSEENYEQDTIKTKEKE